MTDKDIKFIEDTEELLNWAVNSIELGIQSGMYKQYATPIEFILSVVEEIAVLQGKTGDAAKFNREVNSLDKDKLH